MAGEMKRLSLRTASICPSRQCLPRWTDSLTQSIEFMMFIRPERGNIHSSNMCYVVAYCYSDFLIAPLVTPIFSKSEDATDYTVASSPDFQTLLGRREGLLTCYKNLVPEMLLFSG